MSMYNIADELDAVIRNRRKYAAFFDWPQIRLSRNKSTYGVGGP